MKIQSNFPKSDLPPWYWSRGLHDAYVSGVRHRDDLCCDNCCHNCLELTIDARQAMFDTTVTHIRFFNYKVLTPDADITNAWWLSDELLTRNGKYILNLTCRSKKEIIHWSIRFETCTVERK